MINKALLLGHLGHKPEIRTTGDGRRVATFSLATSKRWRDKATGEKRERTEWHRVVVFSEGLVKVVESYLKKGSKVYVEGEIATREWTDKKGIERRSTEIVLQGFGAVLVLLDSRGEGHGPAPEAQAYGLDAGQAAGAVSRGEEVRSTDREGSTSPSAPDYPVPGLDPGIAAGGSSGLRADPAAGLDDEVPF